MQALVAQIEVVRAGAGPNPDQAARDVGQQEGHHVPRLGHRDRRSIAPGNDQMQQVVLALEQIPPTTDDAREFGGFVEVLPGRGSRRAGRRGLREADWQALGDGAREAIQHDVAAGEGGRVVQSRAAETRIS